MGKVAELSSASKNIIVRLRNRGTSYSNIANAVGTSKSTVYFTLKNYRTRGSTGSLPRSGRPRVTTGRVDKVIRRMSVSNPRLTACYDLRFPEMSLALRERGAEILTFPSAFTVSTGLAHWEVLLRARAIETQCYVIAAAQTGIHNSNRSSYGHAMIVDPWGRVIAQCREGTDVAVAKVDLEYLRKIRQEMPVHSHRRPDVYSLPCGHLQSFPRDDAEFQFGQVLIKGKMLFMRTSMSMAFVNKKCVLSGRILFLSPLNVLASPIREAKHLQDLTPMELQDLFTLVQRVQKVLGVVYSTQSFTVTVQDGPHAGQTIQHVHVHILPRKEGDLANNDDIYDRLEKHDKGHDIQWREEEEMVQECEHLRSIASSLYSIPS
ncbi:unnamed protein product [Darwinula stevensoni]|uniref:bis(5'-adenosyl)-triphosphatase n=1 Tax=Darwinula stevensoni TaxID=69355 RepID=A0A7R8XGA8_9CRUS|nr:unnamed protein product [Darwinula stevensoni]CAG0891316.1 unnamed protein product [Darwinula stevensoni]